MVPTIDTVDYNKRMIAISNNDTTGRWPVKRHILCLDVPYNRIIAFGNLYSTRMGILGEIPREQMIAKLQGEVAKWNAADSTVKAIGITLYMPLRLRDRPEQQTCIACACLLNK
jgi:hypothetical protein